MMIYYRVSYSVCVKREISATHAQNNRWRKSTFAFFDRGGEWKVMSFLQRLKAFLAAALVCLSALDYASGHACIHGARKERVSNNVQSAGGAQLLREFSAVDNGSKDGRMDESKASGRSAADAVLHTSRRHHHLNVCCLLAERSAPIASS